jgi:hypothetical protein
MVSTLDHHLPKATFPALAVAPANLIPSCFDCNHGKLAVRASAPEEETLHPYFDDFTKEQWLHAVVLEVSPPALRFSAKPPEGWDALRSARSARHLFVFKLGKLYAVHAAEELINIRDSLSAEHRRSGSDGIRQFLREAAESREAACLNSWQTATYKALYRSEWFCEAGYATIGY